MDKSDFQTQYEQSIFNEIESDLPDGTDFEDFQDELDEMVEW